MYTPLYVKSNYSFLSSLVKVDELVDNCSFKSIKSLAICDDNMIATMLFYKQCVAKGIKPIIGLEVKFKGYFIALYAKSFVGYQNILKIFTDGIEVSYSKLKEFSIDVLCVIPFISLEIFNELKSIYNDIYVGISSKEEEYSASMLTENVVIFNKILYVSKKDNKYFKYSIMMKEKKNVLDNVEYVDNYNYILNDLELNRLCSEKAIINSNIIADMCNLEFPKYDNLIPIYENNLGLPSNEYLTSLSIQGMTVRLNGNVSDVYKNRLLYELDVIKKMGFSDYFLIVYDYVKYAKKKGILVGPGRGSAGGSLVAYALGIIDVDPIKYELLFERFLNPGRSTMPDIDIDFSDIYRDDVINYVKNKYGEKKVAGIVAIGTLKAKAVLDDVSKILKISQDKVERLKKFIDFNVSLKDIYNSNEEFKNIIDNDDRLSLLYDVSVFFEGFPKNTTTHASGIIISRVDLDMVIPLIKQDNMYNSAFEMGYLEELGLLKMDFLGNRNLTTIMNILNNIKKYENLYLDFLNIPLNDPTTLNLFYNVDTNGIFQFESDVMKGLLKKLKVNTFDDIVAADALVRPGPDTNSYIERKNKKIKVEYPSKEVEAVLASTYGVMIYQEQIMQIANIMAGFSLSEADILRRAMSKKKKEVLKVQEESFIAGAIKKGYTYYVAKSFYDDILSFAQYGFNKSHAVAYSMIAYKMGYLKAHYSKYFYLSLLSMIIGSDSKTLQIIREAKNKGVKFFLPNINKSTDKYEIVDDGILFPLSNIRNIGVNTALDIVKVRGNGFKNLFHCFTKLIEVGINRKNIESLVYASCFDCFGYNKNTIICNLDNLLTYAFIAKGLDSDIIEHPTIEEHLEFSRDVLMLKEKELFGFYLSHHPTTMYKEKYKVVDLIDVERYWNKIIDTLVLIEKIKYHTDKKGNRMAFITGSDEISSCEYIIFSKVFDTISDVAKGDILLVRGKVERKENYQIIVEKAKIVS